MSLRDDLRKIVLDPKRGNGGLPAAQPREGIPSSRGDADYQAAVEDGGVSDLTEVPDSREFFDTEHEWKDASGVFVIVYNNLRKTTLRDTDGVEMVVELQDV